MQDRFRFRYSYNNHIYNVLGIDFDFSRAVLHSLVGTETFMCKINLDNLIPCTGKRDKNGILAYEDDIVEESRFTGKNADRHKRWLIMEDIDGTGFQLKQINPSKYDRSHWHVNRLQYDYTIIGNKYENPELLEE